jgi:hypothetical protein
MTQVAFQANAFQSPYPSALYAFQAVNNQVTISSTDGIRVYGLRDIEIKIDGVSMLQTYRTGAAIVITADVRDPTSIPGEFVDVDTATLSLFNPDETVITPVLMTRQSLGHYIYTYQSVSNNQVGAYRGNISLVNGSNTFKTLDQVLFILQSA